MKLGLGPVRADRAQTESHSRSQTRFGPCQNLNLADDGAVCGAHIIVSQP